MFSSTQKEVLTGMCKTFGARIIEAGTAFIIYPSTGTATGNSTQRARSTTTPTRGRGRPPKLATASSKTTTTRMRTARKRAGGLGPGAILYERLTKAPNGLTAAQLLRAAPSNWKANHVARATGLWTKAGKVRQEGERFIATGLGIVAAQQQAA